MNPNSLTDADFRELARRWEGTPQHQAHLTWQDRIRAQQGTLLAPVPAPAPVATLVPVPAPVQWSLFD